MKDTISGFKNEYRFLSNFWPCTVSYEGVIYPSTEHAYQAAKTLDQEKRKSIARAPTPGAAKRAGSKVALRPSWNEMKLEVMETLLREKFQIPSLRDRLLATGTMSLVEYNTWGDKFRGVCAGHGENHLGKLLMKIRAELEAARFLDEAGPWDDHSNDDLNLPPSY